MNSKTKTNIYKGELNEMEMINETTNIGVVSDYFGQDYSEIVPKLVEMWDNALTIELKNSICESRIIQQVNTTTTVSVFYELTFAKLKIIVLKVLIAEFYDETKKQDKLDIVDEATMIVGVEPIS